MRRLEPRLVPKQERSAETRTRILEAAARVFSSSGYAKGTTNRVAEEAGLSVGSLYQYFPNKDAILVELSREHIREGEAIIAARFADPDLPVDLEGRVRVFVEAAVANHIDMPRLHAVLFEQAPWSPELVAELRAFEERTIAAAEALLAADPSVHVPDLHAAATVVVGTIEALTHRFIVDQPDSIAAPAFVDEMVALVSGYLTGRSAPAGSR
jgi:AcrR family transcriptional regulator